MLILIPSSLQFADIQRLALVTMASQELELRQGQANDALEGLRLALGHKNFVVLNQSEGSASRGVMWTLTPDSGRMLGALGRTLWLEGTFVGPKTKFPDT